MRWINRPNDGYNEMRCDIPPFQNEFDEPSTMKKTESTDAWIDPGPCIQMQQSRL